MEPLWAMNQQLTLLWFYDLALNSVILNGCRSDCRYVRALIRLYSHVFYFTPYLLWSSDTDVPHPGLMLEGLDPCFSVVSLWGHRRHVGPVEVTEDRSRPWLWPGRSPGELCGQSNRSVSCRWVWHWSRRSLSVESERAWEDWQPTRRDRNEA